MGTNSRQSTSASVVSASDSWFGVSSADGVGVAVGSAQGVAVAGAGLGSDGATGRGVSASVGAGVGGTGVAARAAGEAAGLEDKVTAGARCGPIVGVGEGAATAGPGAAKLTSSATTANRSERRMLPD